MFTLIWRIFCAITSFCAWIASVIFYFYGAHALIYGNYQETTAYASMGILLSIWMNKKGDSDVI